jgi:hypothetical protein
MVCGLGAPYDPINATLLSGNIAYIFNYANCVTSNMATPMIVIAFFLIVFIGSLIAQQKITGTMKVASSALAACFATLGLEVIMMQRTLIQTPIFVITIAATILSFWWVAAQDSENPYGQ